MKVEIFLVIHMPTNVLLYPGHLDYFLMQFRILYKSYKNVDTFILAKTYLLDFRLQVLTRETIASKALPLLSCSVSISTLIFFGMRLR